MKNKTELKNVINQYKAVAIQNGKEMSAITALLTPLYAALDNYYGVPVDVALTNAIMALTHYSLRAGIQYENGLSSGSIGNPCTGWQNVSELFNFEDTICNVSPETFMNTIYEVQDPETNTTDLKSSLVEEWIQALVQGTTSVPAGLTTIASTANSLALGNALEDVLEPKKMIRVPTAKEIARDIYITREYLKVIKGKGLNVFVPSYIEE